MGICKLRSIILLLALCFLLFFWRLGERPFYNRGESREGLVVSEMHASGNWILPKVNGDYIPFKPPLFHWVGALTATALGNVNEFSIRFPSALFAALGVLLVYATGTRLWGERAGLIAAVVLATCPEWWRGGTIAQVDMTLAFFMLAAFVQFLFLYQSRTPGVTKPIALAVFLALATLAKGPVGAVLPSLAFVIFLWLERDLAFIKRLHPFIAAMVFILVAGSWYALAGWQGGKAFFLRQILEETVSTAAGSYGHFQPPYYFIPVFFSNMAPWSLFVPFLALWIYQERHRLKEEKLLYPLVWLVTVFVFFSLANGKRGIYILPLYPAAALIFGAAWQKLEKGQVTVPGVARLIGYVIAVSSLLACAIFLANAGGLPYLNRPLGKLSGILALFPPAWFAGLCVTLAAVAASLVWALAEKRWRWAFAAISVLTVVTTIGIERIYYPAVASARTLKPFMMRVREEVDPEAPLLFYNSFDYGAIFYSGRHIASFQTDGNEPAQPFFLLMWKEEWKELAGRKGLEALDRSAGTGPVGRHVMILVKAAGNLQLPAPRPRRRLAGSSGEAS